MKPPNIVIVHVLSAEWSKKLFTITHYELQSGKCIVTQQLSAYNIAARLESQAEAGEVVISQQVYERLKGRIWAESLGVRELKGIAGGWKCIGFWELRGDIRSK